MSKRGRPRTTTGAVYQRTGSAFWWARYRDKEGGIRKESTGATDREEAERFLRDRLDARDDGNLPSVLAGKTLTFDGWADLVFGEEVEAAVSGTEDARRQSERAEVLAARVRVPSALGDHTGGD